MTNYIEILMYSIKAFLSNSLLVVRMASKSHTNPAAFGLEIIGSLIYLVVVYVVSSEGYGVGNPVLSGAGALWLPILYSAAVMGSILLFLASFTNLFGGGVGMRKVAFAPAWLAGFALVAFTAGTGWFWVTVLGFVLSILGVAVSGTK